MPPLKFGRNGWITVLSSKDGPGRLGIDVRKDGTVSVVQPVEGGYIQTEVSPAGAVTQATGHTLDEIRGWQQPRRRPS